MSDRHYNDQDAEEILRLASREVATGSMTKEKLLQTAAELGISPEAVERAEKQLVMKKEADRIQDEDKVLRKQYQQEKKNSFMGDFFSYLGVNAFLIGIWWFTGAHYFWPKWVLFGWGLAVVGDFVTTFFGEDEAKFQRWKKRRTRKSQGSKEISDQAIPILDELATSGETVGKLSAIKELRERLQLDLRDAKDAVEDYEQKNPGIFT
jgi:hypothetical protein